MAVLEVLLCVGAGYCGGFLSLLLLLNQKAVRESRKWRAEL